MQNKCDEVLKERQGERGEVETKYQNVCSYEVQFVKVLILTKEPSYPICIETEHSYELVVI